MTGWTSQHVRHVGELFKQSRNPVARVYESIGSDCFLAIAPGWLNLGLWDGPGTEDEAEQACRRLVETTAAELPAGGVIVDIGNGLGTQDPVLARAASPESADRRQHCRVAAGSRPESACGRRCCAGCRRRGPIAVRRGHGRRDYQRGGRISLPVPKGILRRVLPGASARRRAEHHRHRDRALAARSRRAHGWRDSAAGVRSCARNAAMTTEQITEAARAAGLVDVEATACGDRVIAPALQLTAARLSRIAAAPTGHRSAARVLLWQVELLWRSTDHRLPAGAGGASLTRPSASQPLLSAAPREAITSWLSAVAIRPGGWRIHRADRPADHDQRCHRRRVPWRSDLLIQAVLGRVRGTGAARSAV